MTQFVTITDPKRIPDFERVFGSARVPVKQRLPVPFMAELPGIGKQAVYELDVDALPSDQRSRLIEFGAERFGMSREEAERELADNGFPILADSCLWVGDGRDFL